MEEEGKTAAMNKMIFIKMLVVSVLTGIILIALAAVYGILVNRESYREDAVKSISDSYAGSQQLIGPVFVQPYTQTVDDVALGDKGERRVTSHKVEGSYLIFPSTLSVHGIVRPSERHHGLYKVMVYELESHLEGTFNIPASGLTGQIAYGTPYLALRLSDVRGIIGSPSLLANHKQVQITGIATERAGSWKPNLQALLQDTPGGVPSTVTFALDLTFAGTQQLSLTPVATTNRFELTSTWPTPLFAGRFLPRTREVTNNGFHAVWEISSLAAATQNQMTTQSAADVDSINVKLLNPIDPYKLSDRAVKYGVLFVLLTFGGFFLFEIVKRLPIHPVQYLLVGFGLTLFFLLLISLSEHIAFAAAYLIACIACIGLLTYYLCFVLRSVVYGVWFGSMLTLLYAAIYGLLISEDNALMLGSLLLFALLAGIMVATRKVDWYQGSAELMRVKAAQNAAPPPPRPTDL